MEKRALIAIVISFLILVGWSYLFPPAKPPAEPELAAVQESAAGEPQPPQPLTSEVEREIPPEEEKRDEAVVQAAEEERLQINTGVHDLILTNRGGLVRSWKLLHYTTPDGMSLELLPSFEENGAGFLAIELDDPALADAFRNALYTVERKRVFAEGAEGPGEKITFTWSDGRGLKAVKTLLFREAEYLVEVALEVTDRGRRLPARLALGPGFAAQEPSTNKSNYYYNGQVVWNQGGEVTRLRKKRLDPSGTTDEQTGAKEDRK